MIAPPHPDCVCLRCKHWWGIIGGWEGTEIGEHIACEAFPDGIPQDILGAENDHTEAFRGDHGVRFEPSAGTSE